MTTGEVTTKAGRREWIGLAVLALPTFVVAIDLFVLMLALPNLASDLGADSNQQLWTMDIYGFVLAGFLVTMGTVGDRVGRRKILLFGAVTFGIASLLCAYATSVEMLIASRALLGVAGAALGPSTLALITNLFRDPKQQAAAFGIWGGTFTLGALFGPILGGAMLAQWWWGSVFLIGVPVMVLVLVLGPKFLPEYRNESPGRVDPASVVLSLAALLLTVYGIKELARNGVETTAVVALLIGLAAGTAFVRRQRRIENPLLDLGLIGNKTIRTSLGGQLGYSSMGGAVMLFMMLYFQLVHGMSTLQAGLAMVPGMAAGTLGFMVAPKLANRFRPAYVIAAGLVGVALTLIAFTQITATSGTAVLIVGFAVISFCGAPMAGLGTALAVGSAPPEKAGSAGSLAQMANEFGSTLGIAILGTIGTAVYRNQIADRVPAEVPADVAGPARDSLAGATAAAGEVPASVGGALLSSAQQAFTSGLHTVVVIGAVLLLAAATLIITRLRHVPAFGQAAQQAPEPAESTADTVLAASAPEKV